jgi:fatty acid amide hydrolase
LLQIMAGDATATIESDVVPAPLRSSRDVSIRGLRVAYWRENGFFPNAPAVRRSVDEAVAALAAQGAIVEEMTPPKIAEAMFLYTATMGADGAADAERQLRGSKVERTITHLLLLGRLPNWLRSPVAWAVEKTGSKHKAGLIRTARSRSADEFWQLSYRIQLYCQAFLDSFAAKYDALVIPTYAIPAPRHGHALDLIAAAGDTLFVNLLGVPSGVVPVTRVRPGEESDRPASGEHAAKRARLAENDSAGLPIGVQVVSHFWREDIVLAAMQAIERGCKTSSDYPVTPVEL